MSSYDNLLSLDDVNFTETDPAVIESELLNDYQQTTKKVLYPGDPVRLFLSTLAYRVSQERVIYNNAARQTLLRYAQGTKLDHIGAMFGAYRLQSEYAKTTLQFSIQAPLSFNIVIPAGTRATTKDGSAIFATDEEIIILAGRLSVTVTATCLTAGEAFNHILVGEVNTMIDPIAYVNELTNTKETSGGSDIENDDDFRQRIALAPESFSSAGPELAYKYHALSAHKNISSVSIEGTPTGGIINVFVLLKNGIIPDVNSVEITAVKNALNAEKIRPINDTVDVYPATGIVSDYSLTWYLTKSTSSLQSAIAKKITEAVVQYETWQTSTLGRDINPDELIALCKAAGAKRIVLNGLDYRSLSQNEVCQFNTNANRILYGGEEQGD